MAIEATPDGAKGPAIPLRAHLLRLTLACSIPIVLAACVLGYFFVENEYQRAQSMRDDWLIRLHLLPPLLRGLPELLRREIGAQREHAVARTRGATCATIVPGFRGLTVRSSGAMRASE